MGSMKDKTAIIGVGCTKFGEQWEKDAEDLIVEAAYEAMDDAGITPDDIEATWVGNLYDFTGLSGSVAAEPLKLFGRPTTRVENFCASGMDAFRNACFAVASGAYDVVMACGVEKLMDVGGSGLPVDMGHPVLRGSSAPGMFALAATRSFHEHGWDREDLARVAVKNHKNGAQHSKAHFQREITLETALNAPMIAWPLGRFDACAMSDGAAAVIITRPEIAKKSKHKHDYALTKASVLTMDVFLPMYREAYDWLGFPATENAAKQAYAEAGIKNPVEEIDLAEVHDCFTITELLNIQDLGFCERGEAAKFVREGHADVGGKVAINASGGLKCFGHPIGATGCRMLCEITKQLQGRADGAQVENARLGMAHNLGGPGSVCAVTILGLPE
ncbi:MAG: acetyl-CoA acetyltransferase [Deltaproteobacteria bacterium]|nr:acetyl-CoA acetyltransferase [Deltaproteobacteria bacterium]MBW2401352.1 acetyl-CoA acetyltransferase [Deltaproteobacteria bacterium]